jgi:hypothetical protein
LNSTPSIPISPALGLPRVPVRGRTEPQLLGLTEERGPFLQRDPPCGSEHKDLHGVGGSRNYTGSLMSEVKRNNHVHLHNRTLRPNPLGPDSRKTVIVVLGAEPPSKSERTTVLVEYRLIGVGVGTWELPRPAALGSGFEPPFVVLVVHCALRRRRPLLERESTPTNRPARTTRPQCDGTVTAESKSHW